MASPTILLLPGDGVGFEIMRELSRVLQWLDERRDIHFEIVIDIVGGASFDAHGTPVREETLARAREADAIFLGAVGGPKWDGLDFAQRPERALLRLRKSLDLYANLRPAICFDELADESSLRREIVAGLDLMVVRELTGGVYFGEPRGIETLEGGARRGVNTHVYTTDEIRRVAEVAFTIARERRNHVCSADKANVMEAGALWREEVSALHEARFADVTLSHIYADNCAMQIVRDPRQFDVILTDNLFGDILSDEAAMLTGSIGMLPSASLGAAMPNSRPRALYEPVHGSAPDIAGKNQVNPIAMLLSLAMGLRISFHLEEEADMIEKAIRECLAGGLRTSDIMSRGKARVSTSTMGEAIVTRLESAHGTRRTRKVLHA